MPAGLLPDEGLAAQLAYILSADIAGVVPWQLVLWANDLTPSYQTVWADLVECAWPGYSRRILTRANWTAPVVNQGCAQSTYGTVPQAYQVGTVPAGTVVYGAAYYDQSSGVLRWVQRFDDPDLAALVSGSVYQVLPSYTLTSAACSMAGKNKPPRGRVTKGKRRG